MTRAGRFFALLAMLGMLAAGCGGNGTDLMFTPGNPWGVAKQRDAVGKLWAAGSIPLCTLGSAPVKLVDMSAVAVRGQIRLDRIAVRKVHWWYRNGEGDNPATHVIGTYLGVPPGSHRPAGYVVRSSCRFRHQTDPVYEAVVVAERTGPSEGKSKDSGFPTRVGRM